MNSNRFNELLERYLADLATDQERDELMAMIVKGNYDETLRSNIESMLMDIRDEQRMDESTARGIFKDILASEVPAESSVRSRRVAPVRWYAVAAVFVVLMIAGWWVYQIEPAPVTPVTSVVSEPERAIFSGKQFIRLPDGSTVLLNDGSRLSYAPEFGERDREVNLRGEAYFNVRHDAGKPFRVVTGKITTMVLGTTFNVSAYPEAQEVEITVTQGKVQVNNSDRMLGIITPDQQISINTVTFNFVQRNVNAETANAWQSEYLILDDVSLGEAANIISRRYDVRITLANEKLEACRISATFLKGENLDQILTVVSAVVQATYSKEEDGNITIEGTGCN